MFAITSNICSLFWDFTHVLEFWYISQITEVLFIFLDSFFSVFFQLDDFYWPVFKSPNLFSGISSIGKGPVSFYVFLKEAPIFDSYKVKISENLNQSSEHLWVSELFMYSCSTQHSQRAIWDVMAYTLENHPPYNMNKPSLSIVLLHSDYFICVIITLIF